MEQGHYGDTDLSGLPPEAFKDPEEDAGLPPSVDANSLAQPHPELHVPNRTIQLEYIPAENGTFTAHVSETEEAQYNDAVAAGKKALEKSITASPGTPREELIAGYEEARVKFVGAAGLREVLDPFTTLDLAYSMDRLIELDGVKPYEKEAVGIDRKDQWRGMSNQLYNLAWHMIAEAADTPEKVNAALVVAERLETVHEDRSRAVIVLSEAKSKINQYDVEMAEVISGFATAHPDVKREVAAAAMRNLITSSHRVPSVV